MHAVRLSLAVALLAFISATGRADDAPTWLESGEFQWTTGPPLVTPKAQPGETCYSVKDPTIVRHDGRWHLFVTVRANPRSHRVEYLSFADWDQADAAERHVLPITDGYYCAPQVFYFSPRRRWYLVYQTAAPERTPGLQPAFSTSERVDDPTGWTKPTLLFREGPENVERWIDFWIICDDRLAHLFFTSLDGRMWRAETTLDAFPHGWSRPEVVLEGDIFEASHTYRLRGLEKYLTIVEAQDSGRRYYKAYLADRLAGPWTPLADSRDHPFAGRANVRHAGAHWSDSFSHGELLRSGVDERLEVDPARLELLYQGVSDPLRSGKPYGQIPWRLGMLRPSEASVNVRDE